MVAAVLGSQVILWSENTNFNKKGLFMIRDFSSFTVFESCHPYHKLVGGNNARKSIEICGEDAISHQIDCRNSRNLEELILAPTTNL